MWSVWWLSQQQVRVGGMGSDVVVKELCWAHLYNYDASPCAAQGTLLDECPHCNQPIVLAHATRGQPIDAAHPADKMA